MYVLHIDNQDYSKYRLINDKETITLNIPVLIRYLFHGDIVNINQDHSKIDFIERPIQLKSIVGELELYSRYSFKSNKKGVPGYIFRPLDYRYPKFLVHSKLKRTSAHNLLVTIQFHNWEKNAIFPRGYLVKNLGYINDKKAIQESLLSKYILDMENIKHSFEGIPLQFENLLNSNIDREKLTGDIVSIDPDGCGDVDDAFTYKYIKDAIILDIHISDVYYLLNQLGLINKVRNVTSIYLDSYVKPMLPDIISSNYGSLLEKTTRFMLSLKIKYCTKTNKIVETCLRKTIGEVKKNYTYDNYPKKYNKSFKIIEDIYKQITGQTIKIDESHKFIEALMIIYNTYFSRITSDNEISLYRVQDKYKTNIIDPNADSSLGKFLSLITSSSAKYSLQQKGHATLNISYYTHATSPLRRIADLMNQEIFYTNQCSIIDNVSIDCINEYNKRLKKCYRDINKILLAHDVYNTQSYYSKCYIYRYDDSKKKCYLYFPGENISLKTKLLSYKLSDKFSTELSDNSIIMTDETKKEIYKIPLNSLLDVNINGKPNIYDPDKSLIIDFGVFKVK